MVCADEKQGAHDVLVAACMCVSIHTCREEQAGQLVCCMSGRGFAGVELQQQAFSLPGLGWLRQR